MIEQLQSYKNKTIKVHLEEDWNFLGTVDGIDLKERILIMSTDTTQIIVAIDCIKAITFVEAYAKGPKYTLRPKGYSPYDPMIGRDYDRR